MVMDDTVRRGDVFLVSPDPTSGDEIRKARPCIVISPDELNAHLRTYIVAPLTSGGHPYPFRIQCRFQGRLGYIVLDQVRTIDCSRMARKLGKISASALARALAVLREMFTP
ncbi:MAG: type II toxin-antitoxin system PemK/MazF family toxin [Syntrophobacter sp.]